MRPIFALLALLVSVSLCTNGICDDEAEAKKSFSAGVESFNSGSYEEAVQQFRKANELHPSWKIFYNIGQCEAALKRYGLALEAFEYYLAKGGDEVTDHRRDEVINEMRRFKELVGVVKVTGPDGLDVYIDGVHRGKTPSSTGFLTSVGVPHEIKVMDGDEVRIAQTETLSGGLALTIDLTPKDETNEPQPAIPEKKGLSPVFFWIGVVATGVFGGTALGLEFGIKNKIDDIHADPDNMDLRDSAKNMQRANYVMIGLTGAALVTTGVLAFITDFKKEEISSSDNNVSLAPWASGDGAGLALGGRF